MGGRGGAWQSRKLSFCCCVLLRCRPASPKSHSLSVRVCQSCLPLAPLSSPLIDSSFRLPFVCTLYGSLSLLPLFLVFSCPFRFAVFLSAPLLVFFTSQDKVGYSIYYTQKGFCVSLLACLADCFFLLYPTCLFLVLPRCPPLSLAGACVVSSRLWQAERRKMKAQSSKMHQHEY